MASGNNADGEEHQVKKQMSELKKTLKEGEKILAPTRRPDGTLRKPIRVRAGYTPPEEVAKYQSKGALMKKEMSSSQNGPPGYDPSLDAKPKTKNVKRQEKKKEKRLQAALDKDKNSDQVEGEESKNEEFVAHHNETSESDLLSFQMNELAVSTETTAVQPPSDPSEDSNRGDSVQDIDKRIRALKKKIRLTEAQKEKGLQMNPEQLEKFAKLESWRQELKLLEERKTELTES